MEAQDMSIYIKFRIDLTISKDKEFKFFWDIIYVIDISDKKSKGPKLNLGSYRM